jgi:lysophospholipase L1-like esterase
LVAGSLELGIPGEREEALKPLSVVLRLSLVAALCLGGTVAAMDRDDALALALGDSVAFGYITQAGYEYGNPDNFVGFPDYVANLLRLDVVNAACPGETTSSFLSSAGMDDGCRAFRAQLPLHVAYSSTQLAFATDYLRRHRDLRLVTITLGANDALLLEAACASQVDPAACIQAGLPTLLATVAANMQAILTDLRATGYGGMIIVTNYYSTDYSDAAGTGLIASLNTAIVSPTRAFGAVVADLFTAFRTVASNPFFAGKTCNAGLLNASPQNQLLCDLHPSQSGHRLIAQAVARVHDRSDW